MRNWSLRHIYLYLVSFVALMLVMTGMIRGVMACADYFLPQNYYVASPIDAYNRYTGPDGKQSLPKEVIDQQIAYEAEQSKNSVRMSALGELKRGLAYVVVALPMWLYHWRRIQVEFKAQMGAANPPAGGGIA